MADSFEHCSLLYVSFLGCRYVMRVYKEVVAAYFKVLFQNSLEEADEINEELQTWYPGRNSNPGPPIYEVGD